MYEHVEDGVTVYACTRGKDSHSSEAGGFRGYITSADSRYYASARTNVGSTGIGAGGQVVTLWTTEPNDTGVTITGYQGNASVLYIPETIDGQTVTRIGSNAFENNTALRSVVIPDTVTRIAEYSFDGCTNLKTVEFSESLTEIGAGAFANCKALTEVELPEGLLKLDKRYSNYQGVFYNCTSLAKAYIPSTLDSAEEAFRGCTSLDNIIFGEGIPQIPYGLFRNCTGLTHIEIPDTVTTIETYAFADCTNLKTVEFSENLDVIGDRAFYNCTSLTNIEIPDTVTTIKEYAFDGCTNLKTVEFSEGLTEIGAGAFANCKALTEVELPEGLLKLDKRYSNYQGVFYNCTSLAKAYIPSTLDSAEEAFYGCTSLDNITFGAGIPKIPYGMFRNCTGLTHIEIPDTVTTIEAYAFDDCTNLKGVEIPDTVISVGNYAFSSPGLESIAFPSSVTKYGTYVLQGCTKLEQVTLSENASVIPTNMFDGCKSLQHITIPQCVTEIASNAFYGCAALTDITLPDSVTKLGDAVFQQCSKLANAKLSAGLTQIPAYAFANCNALTELVIPNGVRTIGNNAFYQCAKLVKLTLPASLTAIGSNAVSYPTKMTISGCAGTFAEEWADEKNCKAFVDISKPATKLALASGEKTMTIGRYLTVEPVFDFGVQDCTDAVTLKSDNTSIVSVDENGGLYGRKTGTANVTATTTSGKSLTFAVTVDILNGIEIAQLPNKTAYDLDEKRDLTGLKVNAVFQNGNKEQIYDYTVSGFSTSSTKQRTVTITYDKKTATFTTNTSVVITGAADQRDYSGHPGLTQVTVAKGVTALVDGLFKDCKNLTRVEFLGNAPTTIGTDALATGGETILYYHEGATGWLNSTHYDAKTKTWGGLPLEMIPIPTHKITVVKPANGTVSVSQTSAKPGTVITVTATPASGYKLGSILVDGKAIKGMTFTVSGNHTVTATFDRDLPIPAKPHNIVNTVSGVHVYWKAVAGAEKYGLWRSETGKNGTYKWVANPTVPHFTDTKVESGKTYFYKVTSMYAGKHTDKSEALGIAFLSTPDITQRYNKAAGIKLEWNQITGATGYRIYRKSYSGTDAWVKVGEVTGEKTLTWTDESVKNNNGTTYRYTVRAVKSGTLSGCRNTGRTMVRLASRVLNSATKASATSIKCSWTTSAAVTGYEMRFVVNGQVVKTVTIGNYKTGTKTFTGLAAGQKYQVQVRAYKKVDGVGSFYSAWSTAKYVQL